MNHYETLDIPRTASPEEVKQAFRRKASAEHPDKGGDEAAMAAINRAYETLGDPERRARYDETGDDEAGKPIEAEARDVLLSLFNSLLASDGNWLREASAMLEQHRQGLTRILTQAQTQLARLVKRTGKIKVKAGENLVQMLIDQQIAGLRAKVAHVERGMLIAKTAAAMLTAYEQDEEASPYTQQSAMQLLGVMSQQAQGGWR